MTSRRQNGYGRNTKMRLIDIRVYFTFRDLRDRDFAADYLASCLETGGMKLFLSVCETWLMRTGDWGKLSNSISRGRESLYKSLSKSGNPHFATLQHVLNALGLVSDN